MNGHVRISNMTGTNLKYSFCNTDDDGRHEVHAAAATPTTERVGLT